MVAFDDFLAETGDLGEMEASDQVARNEWMGIFHANQLRSQVDTSRYSSDLFGLAYPKAFISKIRCYDNGDRTYPHRDLPAANKHHPFEDEPQGVSDRDDKKNRSRKLRKHILAQLS
jgi:hypothetical protein